jgi:hypothetical protein
MNLVNKSNPNPSAPCYNNFYGRNLLNFVAESLYLASHSHDLRLKKIVVNTL